MKPLVLRNLSYGMYAIGVKDGENVNACIVNSVMQLTKATPANSPLLALSISADNYTCECIEKTGMFTVSVLSTETPATVIGALGLVSGRNANKLENIRHKVLAEGVPVVKEKTCCWFLCRVRDTVKIDSRRMFVAEVIAGSDEAVGEPMTYEYYTETLKGAVPLKAPTYLPTQLSHDKMSGESFVCAVCGYVYNDPNFGFEELPENWVCPSCKMPKKAFVRKK